MRPSTLRHRLHLHFVGTPPRQDLVSYAAHNTNTTNKHRERDPPTPTLRHVLQRLDMDDEQWYFKREPHEMSHKSLVNNSLCDHFLLVQPVAQPGA